VRGFWSPDGVYRLNIIDEVLDVIRIAQTHRFFHDVLRGRTEIFGSMKDLLWGGNVVSGAKQ
jgi:hypothetical protein